MGKEEGGGEGWSVLLVTVFSACGRGIGALRCVFLGGAVGKEAAPGSLEEGRLQNGI